MKNGRFGIISGAALLCFASWPAAAAPYCFQLAPYCEVLKVDLNAIKLADNALYLL
jgi:hypothetical protein